MGTVGDAVRPARRLYHQPAQLHPPVDEPVLGQPGRLPEPGHLLAEPRLGNDAVCVPAVFIGRLAVVDHWAWRRWACRVVKTKFWVASILSLFVTSGLIMLSCYLLKMTWDRVLFLPR